MRYKYFLISLIIFFNSFSQEKESFTTYTFPDSFYTLQHIIIHGNNNTQPFVITKELTFAQNTLITHSDLKYNSERIYSLGIFTKVNLTVEPIDSLAKSSPANIHIWVTERLHYIIYPIVGTRDREISKLFYGFGFAHTNFRGRKEYLAFEFIRGYDPSTLILHDNPLLNVENDVFGSFKMISSELKNRSYIVQGDSLVFDTKLLSATVGKRFSVFSRASITLEWKQVKLNYEIPNLFSSPEFRDNIFTTALEYSYDSRDLKEYPATGSFQRYRFIHNLNPDFETAYDRYFIDSRFYKPIFYDNVFALRVFANISQKKFIPIYDHVYFGYLERLAGHYTKVLEGEHLLSSQFEFHIPFIKPQYFQFDEIPMEEFRDFRFAANFSLFGNSSTVWLNNDNLNKLPFYTGWGGGVHFLLPYSLVLKFEYAFGNRGMEKGEFVWDIGATF